MFSILGSLTDFIIATISAGGLAGLFALVAVSNLGIPPLPSEVILPLAGFLVAAGTFSLAGVLLVALVAGLAGSYAGYAIGRWGRARMTGAGLGRLRIDASRLERVDRYFARHGESTVALFRLLPVLRAYISFPAGTARMAPGRFGVFTLIGSIPYTLAFVYAGILLRSDWRAISSYFAVLNLPLLVLIAAGVVYLGLLVAGVLAWGWPPRRAPRADLPAARPAGDTAAPPRRD